MLYITTRIYLSWYLPNPWKAISQFFVPFLHKKVTCYAFYCKQKKMLSKYYLLDKWLPTLQNLRFENQKVIYFTYFWFVPIFTISDPARDTSSYLCIQYCNWYNLPVCLFSEWSRNCHEFHSKYFQVATLFLWDCFVLIICSN